MSPDQNMLVAIALLVVLLPSDAGRAQSSAAPTLASTAACVERAERETELVPAQRARLCIAAPSPSGPVDCFVAATRTLRLTEPQAIELCRCSGTMEPVACVRTLRDAARLTEPEMVAACSPTLTLQLRADCTPIP